MKSWEYLFNFFFYLPCGGEASFRRKCVDFASLNAEDRVIDVCCGTGELLAEIKRQGLAGQVLGVDISEPAIETARAKHRHIPATFLKASAADLPFAPYQFNKCFISFGLHHMPEKVRQKALAEIYRTLAAKGSLHVIDYNLPQKGLKRIAALTLIKLDSSREASKMLKKGSIITEIKQAGFEIAEQASACRGMVQLLKAIKM